MIATGVFVSVCVIFAVMFFMGSSPPEETAVSTTPIDDDSIQLIQPTQKSLEAADSGQQEQEAFGFQSRIEPMAPLPGDATTQIPDKPQPELTELIPEVMETMEPATPDLAEEPGKWLKETVTNGDSLALIFSRLGLSPQQLHRLTHSSEEAEQLTSIKPGESLRIRLDQQNNLQELIYQPNPVETLHFTPHEDGFAARTETKELEPRVGRLAGTIVSSFYLSAQEAGLSDALIMDLATIFGWDIDFALEIRKGDTFAVVFEEDFVDGERYGNGRILAAEFSNKGQIYRAIRYEKDDEDYDYYSPDGRSMRKAFLRAPVDFRRISSRFSKQRFHPVLGKKRPHRGVDYAAAIGTPIKAAGDGKVIFRGTKGGYGRTVILKHGSEYTTLYGHLSRYRSSVKNGTKVRQGEIIGYVGKSGLATGPHLHYEFRINGVHKNPLTVKLPASMPIEKQYKQRFLKVSKKYAQDLDQLKLELQRKTAEQ